MELTLLSAAFDLGFFLAMIPDPIGESLKGRGLITLGDLGNPPPIILALELDLEIHFAVHTRSFQ